MYRGLDFEPRWLLPKIQKERKTWKLVSKILKVVLLLNHVGPPLPVWAARESPKHTLDRDENIFSKTCCSHRKVHPRNHPRKRVGAASLGLPIAPPTARKVFVQRAKWRQLEVQGWVEPILSSAVCSGSYLLGHHAGTVAAVYTTAPASASVGGGWGQTWLPLV